MTAMPTNNGLLGGIFGPSPDGGAGLLNRLNDPRVALGLGMMGTRGGFGERLQGGLGAMQNAQRGQMQQQLMNLQLQGLKGKQEEREAERARRDQQIGILFGGQPAMTGGQAIQQNMQNGGVAGPTPEAAANIGRPAGNQTAGILAQMGYSPEDTQLLMAMGPEAAMQVISERRFAEPDQTGAMKEAAFLYPGDPAAQQEHVRRVATMSKAPVTNISNVSIPAGYQQAPGGGLMPIPGGPADPKNPKNITEGQKGAALYASRLGQAEDVFSDLGAYVPNEGEATLSQTPLIGNRLVSSNYQKFDQASRNFINAVLRRESGAVISEEEFDNARKQYLPQPGDSPAVLAQKAQNRTTARQQFENAAGGALGDVTPSGLPDANALRQKYGLE